MSKLDTRAAKEFSHQATVFAALGDETRLSLLLKLGEGQLFSITQLAEDQPQTRQAIRKHLQVLERARLVCSERHGRENLFRIEPKTLARAGQSLQEISRQWDDALQRLKAFVED